MKKYEYNEPELNIVKVINQDVITTSDLVPKVSAGWETAPSGGVPIISV